MKIGQNVKKSRKINDYLPMQKSLKILPNISSTSTFPTIIPKCLVANLRSSAALSKSWASFLFSKSSRCNTHCSRCCLCLSLVINISWKFINFQDVLITRERHRQHLEQCVSHLDDFENKNQTQDFDKAAEDLRLATRHLGMIVGKVDVEEILGSIFNDFCIGK